MSDAVGLALAVAAGYLLGSIPSGYLLGRWLAGIDLRQYGSGSTGATNTMRVLGARGFALTFAADVLKAAAAILLARALVGDALGPAVAECLAAIATAALVIVQDRGNIARLLAGTERKIGQRA